MYYFIRLPNTRFEEGRCAFLSAIRERMIFELKGTLRQQSLLLEKDPWPVTALLVLMSKYFNPTLSFISFIKLL